MSDASPEVGDLTEYRGRVYRIVEAQHRISTNRLADGPAEQDVIERLVEEAKPDLPAAARDLHYLLGSAFRYGYAKATRFRSAHERPGIFYASEQEATAIAEMAYWRLRFFAASPGMPLPTTSIEHTGLSVLVESRRAIDLAEGRLGAFRDRWQRSDDYGPTQRLASEARALEVQLIRYRSVRDEQEGVNVAVLDPAVFTTRAPRTERTWTFRFFQGELRVFASYPSDEAYRFRFADFGLVHS